MGILIQAPGRVRDGVRDENAGTPLFKGFFIEKCED